MAQLCIVPLCVQKMRVLFKRPFMRFLIVGIINTLIGSAVMFALYNWAKLSYWVASAANYMVGSTVSFFLNKYFTFKNREKSWTQVARFILTILVCYFIAYGLAKPLVRQCLVGQSQSIQDNIAMLVGMCLFVLLNYMGQRFFAFRETRTGAASRRNRGADDTQRESLT